MLWHIQGEQHCTAKYDQHADDRASINYSSGFNRQVKMSHIITCYNEIKVTASHKINVTQSSTCRGIQWWNAS